MKIKLRLFMFVFIFCSLANAAVCPLNNTSTDFFWSCATQNSCTGEYVFSGAAYVQVDGGYRYFCYYNGPISQSMMTTDTFGAPQEGILNGSWIWVGQNALSCQSATPTDCPIPAN